MREMQIKTTVSSHLTPVSMVSLQRGKILSKTSQLQTAALCLYSCGVARVADIKAESAGQGKRELTAHDAEFQLCKMKTF